MIMHTIELERKMDIGESYWQCFKGTNRRRTEIAMVSLTIAEAWDTLLTYA